MTASIESLIEAESDWLSILSNNQRNLLQQLAEANGSLEAAAQAWLDLSTYASVAPFGASPGGRRYYLAFLDALHDKLCSDKEHAEREKLLSSAGVGSATFAATLTRIRE